MRDRDLENFFDHPTPFTFLFAEICCAVYHDICDTKIGYCSSRAAAPNLHRSVSRRYDRPRQRACRKKRRTCRPTAALRSAASKALNDRIDCISDRGADYIAAQLQLFAVPVPVRRSADIRHSTACRKASAAYTLGSSLTTKQIPHNKQFFHKHRKDLSRLLTQAFSIKEKINYDFQV